MYDPSNQSQGCDWSTLLVHELHPRLGSDYEDAIALPSPRAKQYGGSWQGARAYFICPDVSSDLLTTTPGALINHCAAIPGLCRPEPLTNPLSPVGDHMLGMVASHIKRSAEIAIVFDCLLLGAAAGFGMSVDAYLLQRESILNTSSAVHHFDGQLQSTIEQRLNTPLTATSPVDGINPISYQKP